MSDIEKRLRRLGYRGERRGAHIYFSHTGGKVLLRSASEFYDEAVRLADEAATEIERLREFEWMYEGLSK